LDELLTIDETAERLKTSVRFVRRLVAERRIPFTKVGKYVRFYESDVEAFVAAGRVESMTASDVWRGVRRVA
jgi:excisionase family DNA binding protein